MYAILGFILGFVTMHLVLMLFNPKSITQYILCAFLSMGLSVSAILLFNNLA
jgi:hypothetical protein